MQDESASCLHLFKWPYVRPVFPKNHSLVQIPLINRQITVQLGAAHSYYLHPKLSLAIRLMADMRSWFGSNTRPPDDRIRLDEILSSAGDHVDMAKIRHRGRYLEH